MSDDHLIRHCAPTLAGIKTGSLFTCPFVSRQTVFDSICRMNKRLLSKGLRIIPLRFSEDKALIYIYRPKKLSADLNDSAAEQLLQRQGYETGTCEKCIVQLVRRLRQQTDFPHEIGLFLGYPVEDVCGFIENNACNLAAGRSMEMKKPPKRSLPSTGNARRFIATNGQREKILNGW